MHFNFAIFLMCYVTVLKLVHGDVYRLPKTVTPIRYILTMEPFLSQNRFYGSVIIEIKAMESTENITFHKKMLDIDYDSIKIADSSGGAVKIRKASANVYVETYTVRLQNELLKGQRYNITINNFSGSFGHKKGFLLEQYYKGLEARNFAFTHFEPCGARLVFPCFDEPRFKAKFVISLIRPHDYSSASNEALEKTENLGDGRFRDTFKETPMMPTYAVAFVVSDFQSTTRIGKHRVFGPPNLVQSGKLDNALTVGVKVMKSLEEFTGINYTLSKMDQFAVPHFPIYAMENWGLVFYREEFLLHTNKTSLEGTQKTTCYIAHEFAHQWFGNLVTHEWWDYLWLSESFSAYFQYYIASVVQPSWRLMDQFVVDMMHKALRLEEFDSAHPLNYPIERIGEYSKLHIMYEKGSAIVRMTEHFLTHNVFRKGLQIYLQNRKFDTAVPSDLYNAFQKAVDDTNMNHLLANMTVAQILKSWDSKKGFPTVTVTRNYTTGSITLTQFSTIESPRIIPINCVFSSENTTDFTKTTPDFWLTEENLTINNNFPTNGWILVNKQQTGYYRVNYDLENWERLIKFFNSGNFHSIHVLNRAQLIDDAFNLAHNGIIPWYIPLKFCEYLAQERDYIPFVAFHNAIQTYSPFWSSFFRTPEDTSVYFSTHTEYTAPETVYEFERLYMKTTLTGIRDYLSTARWNGTHLEKLHWDKFHKTLFTALHSYK